MSAIKTITVWMCETRYREGLLNGGDAFRVDNYDVPNILSENVFAYRFYKVDTQSITVEDTLFEKRRSYEYSGWHYPGGVVMPLEHIPVTPEYKILRGNMLSNGWSHVVRHRFSGYQAFNPETDTVVPNVSTGWKEVTDYEN